MNRPSIDPPETDAALREALGDFPPPRDTEALQQRVLVQWRASVGAKAVGGPANGLAWWSAWTRPWRWAGVTFGLLMAVGYWLQAPDPVLQELVQVDVLSELTAGQL